MQIQQKKAQGRSNEPCLKSSPREPLLEVLHRRSRRVNSSFYPLRSNSRRLSCGKTKPTI